MAYTVHQAKTHFSRLLKEAEAGQEVIVTRGSKPVAKVVAIGEPLIRRILPIRIQSGLAALNKRIAAANGQFLLVEREAYRRLGGHAMVAEKVLEDVELAFLAKRRKVGLRFRYAEDAVSARMYRSTRAMIEGWTKNLALLFDNSLALAVWRAIDIFLLFLLPVFAVELWNARLFAHSAQWLAAGWVLALLWVRNLFRFYGRVAKSNFPFVDCALAPLGLPLFIVLLYRSWFQHRILKRVSWKGRTYKT